MRFSSSGFFHKSIVHWPFGNPPKYFQKYFVFVEIFAKKGFFRSNFRVMIPGGCTISGYRNPEVAQPPGYDSRKLSDQVKGKLLWFVGQSLKIIYIPNLWVSQPEIATKKTFFPNISAKTKYFWKYFGGFLKGLCTIDSWKKPELENLMLLFL